MTEKIEAKKVVVWDEGADEAAVDKLHAALLDLFLPGHEETAADRARGCERVARMLERANRGDRGGGIGY